MGAALAPDNEAPKRGATPPTDAGVKQPALSRIHTPASAANVPALARVKSSRRHRKAATKTADATQAQTDAGVSGTVAQQTASQPSSGGSTQSKKQTQQKQQTDTGTNALEPPPFDQYTTSTP